MDRWDFKGTKEESYITFVGSSQFCHLVTQWDRHHGKLSLQSFWWSFIGQICSFDTSFRKILRWRNIQEVVVPIFFSPRKICCYKNWAWVEELSNKHCNDEQCHSQVLIWTFCVSVQVHTLCLYWSSVNWVQLCVASSM